MYEQQIEMFCLPSYVKNLFKLIKYTLTNKSRNPISLRKSAVGKLSN